MNEIQIVETPIGEESVVQVCEAATAAFPGFKVAKAEQVEGNWQLRLERVAEFPLKPMAPEEDNEAPEDEPAADEAAEEKSEPSEDGADAKPKKKKAPKDDSEKDGIPEPDADDAPAFGGGDHHAEDADPIARVEKLLRDLQKVVPQLQNLLKGDGLGRDLAPPPHFDSEPGPHFPSPHAPPPTRLPSGVPGGPFGRPGMGAPGAPSRDRMPTFTKRKAMRLTREANVSEQIARTELQRAYPNYNIELSLEGSEYVANLTLKS